MVFKLAIPFTFNLLMIIPVGIALGWINKRLTCLSYGIPVLYIGYKILLGAGTGGNIQSIFWLPYQELIVLIGILHMIEGIMIAADAKNDNKCVVAYKRKQLAGGYQTYKKWVIPLFLCSFKGVYIPILAVVVYADETFTMVPSKKAKLMGGQVFIYGGIVALLGYLAIIRAFPLILVMFGMPLLHEGLFLVNRWIEKGDLLYCYPKRGVRVIEVNEAKQDKSLFNRGDIILGINHQRVNSVDEYYQLLKGVKMRLYIQVRTLGGENKCIVCSLKDIEDTGVVLLPEE